MLRHRADFGLFRRHRLADAISKFRRKPLFEALESRLLLSADIASPLIAEAVTEPASTQVQPTPEPQSVVIRYAPIVVTNDGTAAVQGGNGDNVWRITGRDEGTLNGEAFSGIGVLLGGTGNQDTFVLEPGGSLSGYLDGGVGGNDTLVIDGGSFTDATFKATGPDSGTVQVDGNVIRYLGLEPIIDNSNTTNRVFTGTAGDDQIRLKQGPSGQFTIESQSGTFESITFAAPSTSLTLDAGAGDDVIVIDPLGPGFSASLSVNGSAGTDRIEARRDSGSATLSDTSLTIGSQTIALTGVEQALIGAGTLNSSGFSGPVLFSRSGPRRAPVRSPMRRWRASRISRCRARSTRSCRSMPTPSMSALPTAAYGGPPTAARAGRRLPISSHRCRSAHWRVTQPTPTRSMPAPAR